MSERNETVNSAIVAAFVVQMDRLTSLRLDVAVRTLALRSWCPFGIPPERSER